MKVRHWVRADNSLTVAGVCEVSDMYMYFVLPIKLVFTVYVYAVGKAIHTRWCHPTAQPFCAGVDDVTGSVALEISIAMTR